MYLFFLTDRDKNVSRGCIYYFWPSLEFVNLLRVSAAFWRSLLKPDPAQTASEGGPCPGSLTHRHMPGMGKKKVSLSLKTCSKLRASESGKPSPSQGNSDLSRSGTGFSHWVSNSAFVHETSTQKPNLLTTAMPRRCVQPLGVLFRCTSHTGWSSCFTIVFENSPPLLTVAGDAHRSPRGTLGNTQRYYKHQHGI